MKRQLAPKTYGRFQHATPSATVAIGPERGWTDAEAKLFVKAGFQSALLGPSILRVDTAVVAGVAHICRTAFVVAVLAFDSQIAFLLYRLF